MRALLLLCALAGAAQAGGIIQGGVPPSPLGGPSTFTVVNASTVTITGTGSKCFSVDDPTLVVDCNLNKVTVGGSAGLEVTYGLAAATCGIGTTSPGTKLHMSSGTLTVDGTGAAIRVGASNSSGLQLSAYGTNATPSSNVTFWNQTFVGSEVSNQSNVAETVSGHLFSMGSSRNAASAVGGILESTSLGALGFFTGGAGVSSTIPERMRITSGGTVGIGTASPGRTLDVNGAGVVRGAFDVVGGTTTFYYGGDNRVGIAGLTTGSQAALIYSVGGVDRWNVGINNFVTGELYEIGRPGASAALTIDRSDRVGINTASPCSTCTLHVAGGASVTGDFSLGASTTSISGAWTAWTPVAPAGCSGALTNTSSRYLRIGKTLMLNIDVECTSNATGWEITLPFSPTAVNNMVTCAVRDNGVFVAGLGLVVANSSPTMTVYKDGTLTAAWTNSGTKRVICSGSVEIQ